MSWCCGNVPQVYVGGRWVCSECGALAPQEPKPQTSSEFDWIVGLPIKIKYCECGAEKTSNPNCHAHWCPKYEKN